MCNSFWNEIASVNRGFGVFRVRWGIDKGVFAGILKELFS
jgi:hypothetical protein